MFNALNSSRLEKGVSIMGLIFSKLRMENLTNADENGPSGAVVKGKMKECMKESARETDRQRQRDEMRERERETETERLGEKMSKGGIVGKLY